jgi:hypothetical protein
MNMKQYVKPKIEVITLESPTHLLSASSGNDPTMRSGTPINYQYIEDTESLSKSHGRMTLWDYDED